MSIQSKALKIFHSRLSQKFVYPSYMFRISFVEGRAKVGLSYEEGCLKLGMRNEEWGMGNGEWGMRNGEYFF